jgi:ComF family protein
LQRLIGLYKFERAKSAYSDLGDLLLAALPDLPPDTVVVPVPTLPSHIRQRGYDHTLLIARYVAKSRNLKLEQALSRRNTTTQRHSSASVRQAQAKDAFKATQELDSQKIYLLIDDVATTRSTIKYAAKTLRDAGAGDVWVAVVARQVLG